MQRQQKMVKVSVEVRSGAARFRVGVGRTVTATATDPAGNTSEFSGPTTVVAR